MNPNYGYGYSRTETKKYQLVIMAESGETYVTSRLYDWDGVQDAMREMRELYAKHNVTPHIGYKVV